MSASPLLIAVVDDDPDVRGSLSSLLRSAGLASHGFACGEALLAWDGINLAACIVTDLHMPGMTGIELLHALAGRGWRRPAIMMTAYLTAKAREEAIDAGAVAVFAKPVDPDAFLDAVEHAISGASERP
ncbi:response regulator transcription factor [Flavisphingomonas formosensis]|uniref:response regulator transcription factor n=1 Tax=Flavisphingomonas formosensis TaxID=861534 RepID=UPI0012FB0C7F|nr:response regulator [Sphingomonas formosensis]